MIKLEYLKIKRIRIFTRIPKTKYFFFKIFFDFLIMIYKKKLKKIENKIRGKNFISK